MPGALGPAGPGGGGKRGEIVGKKENFPCSFRPDGALGPIASPLDRLHHRAGPPPPTFPHRGLANWGAHMERRRRAVIPFRPDAICGEMSVSRRESCECGGLGSLAGWLARRRLGARGSRGGIHVRLGLKSECDEKASLSLDRGETDFSRVEEE